MPSFLERIKARKFASAASTAVDIGVNGDAQARLTIDAGGKLTWGTGGIAGDTTLYREDANLLRTDDTFKAPALIVDNIEIDTTGAALNDVLKYDGTKFTAASVSAGGATNLDGLTDVVITAPEEFQGLSYNGTSWVNSHIPLVSYVRNAETTTITTGTCVYLFGSTGDHATVKRADNSSDVTSSKTIGVAGADITASNNGPIITRGYVDGIDLSVGYTAGDVLWLGKNGAFTKTKPTSPDHLVFIGVVVRATNNGIIYVATQNGYELDELHDVAINGKTSGDFLKYNGTLWVNDQINLGTDTVGNYVSGVSAGTGISVTHTPGEGSTATIAVDNTVVRTTDTGTVTSAMIANGTIVDADISSTAAISLSKLSTTGASTGNVVKFNGTAWAAASAGGANVTSSATAPASPNAGDLWLDSTNVDLYIYYDNQWVQLTGEEPAVEDLNDLADVNVPSPVIGQFLKYDGTGWTSASIPAINALDDIGDVSTSGAINGQFLKYNGSAWTAASIPSINALDDITDVNVTGATSGQFLKWNGTTWVADSIVGGATTSSSAPSSPTTGQLWFDTDDARTYVYYDSYWVEVGASGQGATVSDSAPTNPISGQLWYKSDTGGFYIRYSNNWVEVGASPATFPTGKAIAMSIVFGG